MKKMREITKGFIFCLLLAVLSPLFTSICQGQSLIDNPGFEQEENNFPSSWGKWVGKNGCEVRYDNSEAHTGNKSMLITQTKALDLPEEAAEAKSIVRYIFKNKLVGESFLYKYVPVKAGKKYNLSFWFKATGLVREDRDNLKKGYAMFIVQINWLNDEYQAVGGRKSVLWAMKQEMKVMEWRKMSNPHFHGGGALDSIPYLAPPGAKIAQIRFSLITAVPNAMPKAWIDDVNFWDTDSELILTKNIVTKINIPNAGFEQGANGKPEGWKAIGSSVNTWDSKVRHKGKRSVSVANGGMEKFSGWSIELPAKPGALYAVSAWAKGGNLAAMSQVGGGAICLQFLDAEGQIIEKNIISTTVSANSDWTIIRINKYPAPRRTEKLRLIVGLRFCKGTAWFDDLNLTEELNEVVSVAMVKRPNPKPDPEIQYAKNLLSNGTIEEGENGKPKGWTYHGSSEKNWTKADLDYFHNQTFAPFSIGRGKGEWSRKRTYAGKGALLNTSIQPPLSGKMNWSRAAPVDGYWLSASMPCKGGAQYLAGAWIKPSVKIDYTWLGPLEIQFFDGKGKFMKAVNDPVRVGLRFYPVGVWSYWPTMPYIAPSGAKTMRLRFGQDLHPELGSWDRLYGDNFAVWKVEKPISEKKIIELIYQLPAFWKWFKEAHATKKPPYLPSPVEAPEYKSAYGSVENSVPGNIFYTPQAPIKMKFSVNSLIGEKRSLSVTFKRFDYLGNEDGTIEVPAFKVHGYSSATIEFTVPPTKKYGTFYLEGKIMEGDAVVGSAIGRYAVLPKLGRPQTAENIWAVTVLSPKLWCDGRPSEKELGEMLQIAGFGLAWVKTQLKFGEEDGINEALKEIKFFADNGMKSILTINDFKITRPIDTPHFRQLGKTIGEKFKGKVIAYGNWGVEKINHRTPDAAFFRPFIDGTLLSDYEFDQILAPIYEGLKASDPTTPVLTGNLCTDLEGDTIRRLYKKPAEGRFDGAIINPYMGILRMTEVTLAEFDKHGDKKKTVWIEENAYQRAPIDGPIRRYGEVEGAYNMVRIWLMTKCKSGPRLKAMTMWGFAGFHKGYNVAMVTKDLQPRPHFAAHAIMADATADAHFVADRSMPNMTVFEWKRSDGPMFTIWADAGEKSVSFDAPEGKLTVMDCMGNRKVHTATGGIVSLKVTAAPVYVFDGGALKISKMLEAILKYGSLKSEPPQISLTLKNNSQATITGKATFSGPVKANTKQTFNIKAGGTSTLHVSVQKNLATDKRTSFSAKVTTDKGAVYMAASGMNFAQAVKTAQPPSLNGTWNDWKQTKAIKFGITEAQIVKPGYALKESSYDGKDDILGTFRMLWDDKFLYLGVEALDEFYKPQSKRGKMGFMGDSIEFAVQPDNNLSSSAKYWEYELYLPAGETTYAASRRFPTPWEMIENWKATIKTTGKKGNCNYQVAIPWSDIGVEKPIAGKTISFALVLNDIDKGDRLSGHRGRILWFKGIDKMKNPEGFGDVTLVE